MRKRVSSPRGFTLFEAVVAVTIVGLTAVGALSSAGANLRSAERARRAIEAEALATERLDFVDLLDDAELQAVPDSVAKGVFDAPLNEYSWKTTAAPVDGQAGVYDVRVTVLWPGGAYELKSYAYRRPPIATRR